MTALPGAWPSGARALVIGESLVDVVVHPGSAPSARPGGSPMNVAVGLVRLGAGVELATRIGDDAFGRLIADHLDSSGVSLVSGSQRPGERTSTATARIGADGAATYDFDLEWDVAPPDPASAVLVHTGSLAAFLEPGADTVLRCLEHAAGVTSFDANIRPALLGDRAAARERVADIARIADVVKMSDEDAEWLHPGAPPADVARRYTGSGAALVVVTRGSEGSLLAVGADTIAVPSPPVRVADTIGAGDSYMAGLLYASIASGFTGRAGRPLGHEAVERVGRFAASCAAVTVQRVGADLPRLEDVAPQRL